MADRGIAFSAPMISALLAGRKTQTRRLLPKGAVFSEPCDLHERRWLGIPRNAVGDRLYVREAYRADSLLDKIKARDFSKGEPILYECDGTLRTTGSAMIKAGKLRPSIFLPRWASRIWLDVTEVRIERLQDISEKDAIAEGIDYAPDSWTEGGPAPSEIYCDLWGTLHAKPGERWDDNPWVSVTCFNPTRGNLDDSRVEK